MFKTVAIAKGEMGVPAPGTDPSEETAAAIHAPARDVAEFDRQIADLLDGKAGSLDGKTGLDRA